MSEADVACKGPKTHGVLDGDKAVSFFGVFYAIDAVKSARHHPEGVLWLRTGQHAIHGERVSILDIAPTIYDLMGVRGMIAEDAIRGASLIAPRRAHLHAEKRRVA